MPRRQRIDHAGAWHHAYNRGLAKRAMFEHADDVARFLGLLGEAVAIGLIEVHAYCVMMTHFHLLLRSPLGEISKALQWIQNQYVRWYNRSRRRDGTLVRGRFGSQLIEDSVYWETVVRYIDQNPVDARICKIPSAYAHGSASAYRWGEGPDWLARDLVEGVVCEAQNLRSYEGDAYDAWAMEMPIATVRALVERRGRTSGEPLLYDDLLRGASLRQQTWMQFKARLADGTSLGAVVLVADTVRRLIAGCCRARPERRSAPCAKPGSYWDVLEAGVLRDFCALEYREVADLLGISPGAAHYRYERHRRLAVAESDYRMLVSRIARRSLALDLPPRRQELDIPIRLAALHKGENLGRIAHARVTALSRGS